MARIISLHFVATLAILCIVGLYAPFAYAAQSPVIAVIYPELEEPYRGIFSSIIEGIQAQSRVAVKLLPLGEDTNISDFAKSINLESVSAVIALGKTGLAVAEYRRGKIPIIVGALLLKPDKNETGLAGISLAADPELLIAHLKQLAPSVKRLHVVYSPERNNWLVQIARDSIEKFNLKLLTYKSNDIKSSALIYRDILSKSRPGEDAIWLPPDPVAVDSKIIFPLLLRETWNNNVLLISSNPTQVKRGALFALFPDNKLMGISLENMAESYFGVDAADMKNTVLPLKDLQAAINVRTAEHLGLPLSSEERKDYTLIFPAP